MGHGPLLWFYTRGSTCLDADEARRTRRRDYRRLRTELCVSEAWLQQKHVRRQAITHRRKLDTVFSLPGYTKRDDGYHYHQ